MNMDMSLIDLIPLVVTLFGLWAYEALKSRRNRRKGGRPNSGIAKQLMQNGGLR